MLAQSGPFIPTIRTRPVTSGRGVQFIMLGAVVAPFVIGTFFGGVKGAAVGGIVSAGVAVGFSQAVMPGSNPFEFWKATLFGE